MAETIERKEYVIALLEKLIAESDKAYDIVRIREGIDLAVSSHNGQMRRSGEEYVCHPLHVACILVEIGMDSDAVVAGLLHDVVEDTDIELSEIVRRFGQDVANLVDGVTKITKMTFSTREEQQAENVRKMLLAMAKDVRVMIIKLSDRLHNSSTLYTFTPKKMRKYIRETDLFLLPMASYCKKFYPEFGNAFGILKNGIEGMNRSMDVMLQKIEEQENAQQALV